MTFSDAFIHRYGTPVNYWSQWQKLMTCYCRFDPLVMERGPFHAVKFTSFCRRLDGFCVRIDVPVLGRLQMEALYVRTILVMFNRLHVPNDDEKAALRKVLDQASQD